MANNADQLWEAYEKIEDPPSSGLTRHLNYTLDCGPLRDTKRFSSDVRTSIGTSCKEAMTVLFVCWAVPLIAIVGNLFLGVFALVSGVRFFLKAVKSDAARWEAMLKRFLGFLALVLMGMYFSVSMAGASLQLGSAMMAFFATVMCILVCTMMVEISKDELNEHLHKSSISRMIVKFWSSDWARAMFVGAFNVCLPIFLMLNMMRQKVAKCTKITDDNGTFTPTGRRMIDQFKTWNWASILQKICLLGELFFTLQVGVAKATYIFLSWLNRELADLSYTIVIGLIFVIGYTMFLLPPVPGVPVYVFCGIVVAEQGKQYFDGSLLPGCIIACILAWLLKLAACTGQYMIGYFAGKKVSVQALIGVDKVPTRAIERILSAPGLTVGKVAVLVGGPDWPTSVTCGILKLNIPQMLLGTAPVLFVSSPCVLAGAFLAQVKAGEDSMWTALAHTFMGLMGVGQMGCGFLAVREVTRVMEKHEEELSQPREEHAAVQALTASRKVMDDMYREVTQWSRLNLCRKGTIAIAAGSQLFSGFLFAMGGEYCFRSFSVSSDINAPFEENGLNRDVFAIIRWPAGYAALGLFALGTVLHVVFTKDTQWLAKRKMAQSTAEQVAGSTTTESDC